MIDKHENSQLSIMNTKKISQRHLWTLYTFEERWKLSAVDNKQERNESTTYLLYLSKRYFLGYVKAHLFLTFILVHHLKFQTIRPDNEPQHHGLFGLPEPQHLLPILVFAWQACIWLYFSNNGEQVLLSIVKNDISHLIVQCYNRITIGTSCAFLLTWKTHFAASWLSFARTCTYIYIGA